MGVQNLWKALAKGDAVQTLDGSRPGEHAQIVEAVENKVVAVDLSAWLMQAQTQPALLEHYDSPYARAVKVVFDRTIHWLRYGCLPVFVIEGRTPPAKLDKLKARCMAQYGPTARSFDHGNRAGSQFDRLGQAVKRLLDAFGVPCVQAVGEGEAMCAALNVCGWVHACHTLDVDALLFGALTVYRQMHLQTDDPRRSSLTRCCMSDVRRVLGIERGGDAALMAVAHLAGGDYDMAGAEQVGEALALGAVRCLLAGCQDDEAVLQKLEAAIAAGPDPELDALTKCTGCKACGHEGGRKGRINSHSARNGGCAACGCEAGCIPREWSECECAFHSRADERLLNRVVRRAVATPNFINSFRVAADTYLEQTRSAIAAVQREYGLPIPGNSRNVFSWRARPDVHTISDIMCGYIKDWQYSQVRLKLLPLLLEWDVRQGPAPAPTLSPSLQFRPTGIRKVSSKGADTEANAKLPGRQQQGWRYVLLVERLMGQQQRQGAAAGTAVTAAAAAADGGCDAATEADDLEIDLAWIAGKARSKPPKQTAQPSQQQLSQQQLSLQQPSQPSQPLPQQQQQRQGDVFDLLGCDDGEDLHYEDEPCLATQFPSTQGPSQGPATSSSQAPPLSQGPSMSGSQAATAGAGSGVGGASGGAAGSGGGGGGGGSLQFSEHRSVRCSLIDAVWPQLVAAYRQPAPKSRAASGGRKKKSCGAAAASGAAADDKQRTVKDFFGVVKDYTAPGRQPVAKPEAARAAAAATAAAADGGLIPGLAGLAATSSHARSAAAAAAAVGGGGGGVSGGVSRSAAVVAAAARAEGPAPDQQQPDATGLGNNRQFGRLGASPGTPAGRKPAAAADIGSEAPGHSFMEWLEEHQGLSQAVGTCAPQDDKQTPQQQPLPPQPSPPQQQQLQLPQDNMRGSGRQRTLGADDQAIAGHSTAANTAAAAAAPTAVVTERGQQRQGGSSGSNAAHRVFVGARLSQAAGSAGSGRPSSSRGGRSKHQATKTPSKAGPLDRFLRPAAAAAAPSCLQAIQQQQPQRQQQEQQQLEQQHEQQQQQPPSPSSPHSVMDLCEESPEVPSLAARLRARTAAAAAESGGSGCRRTGDVLQQGLGLLQHAAAGAGALPANKKASTDRAKQLLSSPAKDAGAPPAQAVRAAADSPVLLQKAAAGETVEKPAYYCSQYQALLEEVGVASPEEQHQHQQQHPQPPVQFPGASKAARGLFATAQQTAPAAWQSDSVRQPQQEAECIELLESPELGGKTKSAGCQNDLPEVVDLT